MLRRDSQGDRDELREVYREHVGKVYAYFATSFPTSTAEDLTAATFERVVRSWGRYDSSKASVQTWIFAIARNIQTDHYRRERLRASEPLETESGEQILMREEVGFDRVLAQGELQEWLSVLTARQREIIALRYSADLTADQIAALVGLTPSNVHQILSRSLRTLRAKWRDGELSRTS